MQHRVVATNALVSFTPFPRMPLAPHDVHGDLTTGRKGMKIRLSLRWTGTSFKLSLITCSHVWNLQLPTVRLSTHVPKACYTELTPTTKTSPGLINYACAERKLSFTLVLLGDTRHNIRGNMLLRNGTICGTCLHIVYPARAPESVPCFYRIINTLTHINRHYTVYTSTVHMICDDTWDTPVYVGNT